jgi:flavin-binding protein dodecin
MATIPLTISGIKEAKKDLKELGDEFEKFKQDPIKSAKLAKEFNTLSDSIDKAEKSFEELNKSGKNLSATFEQIYGEDLQPMSSRIGELEDRLYELSNAGKQNTQEFQDMAFEAARLRQNIIETDRQVDLLAENKGFGIFGAGISQVGESLLRLDFDGASQSAKALNANVGNLGKMGAQAIKGLGSTVVNLGKAFGKMGMALLANPIFLMASAVTAIVVAVVALMNELGILQPLLDGIGKVFEFIKGIIDKVVQALKDFTDWLGITNNAAKKLAEENLEGLTKVIDRTQDVTDSITMRYDEEIKLAQIAGEDTSRLEIEKQEAVTKTDKIKLEAYKRQLKALEVLGTAEQSEIDAIKQAIKETEKAIKQGESNIKVIKAQADADEDKRREDQLRADQEAYKKRLEAQKKFEQDRLNASRQIQDLELALMEEGLIKELTLNNVRYQRLIENTLANENLLEEEKNALIDLLREERTQKEDALVTDANEKEKAQELAQHEELMALGAQIGEEALALTADYGEEELNQEAENYKKRIAQEEAYAQAKENLQETLVGSLKGLSDSLTKAGIENAGLQKTLALVDIAVNTAKSLSNIIAGATAAAVASGPGAPFVLGGYIASGIATVASAVASAYSALKKAPSIGGSGGGGGGSIGGASVSSATPAQPSFELFGQNNDLNNLSNQGDVESSQEIQVKAVVSETEVTDTQNKIKKIKDSATL